MKYQSTSIYILLGFICFTMGLTLISCTVPISDGPPQAVEAYLNALVTRDQNELIYRSCAQWEVDAKLEFDSFAAVTTTLEDLECSESVLKEGESAVSCTGLIVANYGDEILEINLNDRSFLVVQEAGEWRMCGYR